MRRLVRDYGLRSYCNELRRMHRMLAGRQFPTANATDAGWMPVPYGWILLAGCQMHDYVILLGGKTYGVLPGGAGMVAEQHKHQWQVADWMCPWWVGSIVWTLTVPASIGELWSYRWLTIWAGCTLPNVAICNCLAWCEWNKSQDPIVCTCS